MYRHGLGDCFLLAFGAGNNQQRYVLIDCGVLVGTANADETMKNVANDIKQATDGHLHAVVVTHEHWDHVSGFAQAKLVFETIGVDELWLAWTEDSDDPLAKQLRARRRQAFAALQSVRMRLAANPSAYSQRVEYVMDFYGPPALGAAGRATTESALEWVKGKWDKHVYCSPGNPPLSISGLPHVSFFVLGPPKDERYIRKSRPSRRHSEVYLGDPCSGDLETLLMALGASDSDSPQVLRTLREDESRPFNPAYELKKEDVAVAPILSRYNSDPWRQIETNWGELAGELALKLDAHTNNTSLVLAIELSPGGKVLLFPGDAQVGNWLSWEDITWSDDAHADLKAADLLSRTVLYKVGHHGSHNATLSEKGLEQMSDPNLVALIPVDQETAQKRRWHMPHEPLREQLMERASGRVILSDEGIAELVNSQVHADFLANVKETDLYVDITVKS
jgi:beta-lactamase superfamily II metal-dependent hydrolase